jgi:hypothetical protein
MVKDGMKTIAKYLVLLAATSFAFTGIARAQFVTISDDTSAWTGSVITFAGTGNSFNSEGEAITGAKAIETVTYTFLSTAAASTTGASLSAALVQWSGSTYSVVQSLGTVSIPAPNTWTGSLTYQSISAVTYQQSFDLSFTNTANLNPAATYSVLLTNNSASSTSFGLGFITNPVTGTGTQYLAGEAEGSTAGNGALTAPFNWTFSDVSVLPSGNSIPTPEPTTMAALAAALLVAGLVVYRLRQRQITEAAPAFANVA